MQLKALQRYLAESQAAILSAIVAAETLEKREDVLILPPILTGKPRTEREDQSDFVLAVSHLIQFVYSQGFELTFGDAFRDTRVHGKYGEKVGYSSATSFHKKRLAIDLNLFKDGVYLTNTEAYRFAGEWWIKEYPNKSTWGGKWNDGNHFSWGEK
jgi:hypothetical protein